jgi:hypothetical protein
MRAQVLRDEAFSLLAARTSEDIERCGDTLDALVRAVRDEERARAHASFLGLAESIRALNSIDAAARLVAGIAARDFAPPPDTHTSTNLSAAAPEGDDVRSPAYETRA